MVVGDSHKLHLSVDNKCKSSEAIAFRIKLIGFSVYKAVDRTSSATVEAIDLLVKDDMPIPPQELRQLDINLDVPLDVFPSLPNDLSPLISIQWFVRVACTMKNEHGSTAITSDIPVILSLPLPPPVDAIVHPPMYPSIQPEVRAMIEYGAGVPHFPKSSSFSCPPCPSQSSQFYLSCRYDITLCSHRHASEAGIRLQRPATINCYCHICASAYACVDPRRSSEPSQPRFYRFPAK